MNLYARLLTRVGLPALLGLLILADSMSLALADTPTPSPTPTPPGFNSNSNFAVDNNAALPWPIPATPILPTAVTPQSTVYAATPPHATNYPAQVGTATAQVGAAFAPLNGITTPLAGLISNGPGPDDDDISITSVDGDPILLGDFLNGITDFLGDAFAAIRSIPEDLAELSTTFIILGLLITTIFISIAVRQGAEILAQILKWLLAMFRFARELANTIALLLK